jgi:DNA-binding Lrp family transcriptional regulator
VASAANVTFARSVGGPFELDVLLCVRSLREVSRFFDALSTELKNIEYTKVIAADVGMRFYPPKFLGGASKDVTTIGWSLEDETHSLDEIDQRVLLSLVKTGWTSQSACARAAGIPVSTFEYRVKGLRQKKVILAFGYMLRASTLDIIPYTYLIQVSKSNIALKERFFSFCLSHPNVSYCTESLGGWDFEIGAKFKANVDAQLFLDSLSRELDDCIGSITTIPVYRPVNVALKFTEQFR